MPIFCQKTSILTKTHCSHVIFFEYSMENPLLPCPYLVKKSQFCQNYTILWQKIVNRMPFSSDFHGKMTALIPMFFQKDIHSLKTHCSHAHILSKKRPFSQKHCTLMSFCLNRMPFSSNFERKITALVPMLFKKTSIL